MDTDIFDALPAAPESLVVGGVTLEITPLVLGELPKLARLIKPIAGKFSAEPDWLELLAEHGETVFEVLAIASRQERAWIEALALDDALRLAQALFEANADFFVNRVAPQVVTLVAALMRRLPGATSSSGSSSTATATVTA